MQNSIVEQSVPQTLVELLTLRSDFQSFAMSHTIVDRTLNEVDHITYSELVKRAKTIAVQFQELKGYKEQAILLFSNAIEFVEGFFGCLYAGVLAIPVAIPRKPSEHSQLLFIIKDAGAKFILTTQYLREKFQPIFHSEPFLHHLKFIIPQREKLDLSGLWKYPDINPNSLAFLQYTSGSTGTPKGVMISHENLMQNLRQIEDLMQHSPRCTMLSWLPFFHDMGLVGGILTPIYTGFPGYLMSTLDFMQRPIRWLQAISKFKATTSGGPNFAYELCLRSKPEQRKGLDLSSWDVAYNGAEPIHKNVIDRFLKVFKDYGLKDKALYPCYGMAETTLIASGVQKNIAPVTLYTDRKALEQNKVLLTQSGSDYSKANVGTGQSHPEQTLLIVNPNTKTRCKQNEVGEIWIHGKNVAQGYWMKPRETKETFKAYLSDSHEGPFLRTGDLGFIQNNELYISGRLKDLIIIRGANYAPNDIEKTVSSCNSKLRPGRGAAFSIFAENEEKLVIVQEVENKYAYSGLDSIKRDIINAVAKTHSLNIYKQVLIKAKAIPLTSSGKIRRRECKRLFLEGALNIL